MVDTTRGAGASRFSPLHGPPASRRSRGSRPSRAPAITAVLISPRRLCAMERALPSPRQGRQPHAVKALAPPASPASRGSRDGAGAGQPEWNGPPTGRCGPRSRRPFHSHGASGQPFHSVLPPPCRASERAAALRLSRHRHAPPRALEPDPSLGSRGSGPGRIPTPCPAGGARRRAAPPASPRRTTPAAPVSGEAPPWW